MAHEYCEEDRLELDAAPDMVWEAISTGPGMDAWFMGRMEVDGGPGGYVRADMGHFVQEFTITAWDAGRRLAYATQPRPDGSCLAIEWLIEGRAGGTTILRSVGSGFIASDDWEEEYDSLRRGGRRYLHNMAQYLEHFSGRRGTPINAGVTQTQGGPPVIALLSRHLGLAIRPSLGQTVRLVPKGLPAVEGVVDYSHIDCLGVRSTSGLYRFLLGMGNSAVVEHHLFDQNIDRHEVQGGWQNWLIDVCK